MSCQQPPSSWRSRDTAEHSDYTLSLPLTYLVMTSDVVNDLILYPAFLPPTCYSFSLSHRENALMSCTYFNPSHLISSHLTSPTLSVHHTLSFPMSVAEQNALHFFFTFDLHNLIFETWNYSVLDPSHVAPHDVFHDVPSI